MVSMGRIDVIVNICRLDKSTGAKGQGYRRKRPGRSLSRMPERLRLFLGHGVGLHRRADAGVRSGWRATVGKRSIFRPGDFSGISPAPCGPTR